MFGDTYQPRPHERPPIPAEGIGGSALHTFEKPKWVDAQDFFKFLKIQQAGAQAQHDDRASGKFGDKYNTPEALAFWRGCVSGYQTAIEELELWFHDPDAEGSNDREIFASLHIILLDPPDGTKDPIERKKQVFEALLRAGHTAGCILSVQEVR